MEFKQRLDSIYNMIPNSEPCVENCGECCTPISWTPVEDAFISKYMLANNIEKVDWTVADFAKNNWKCPYLDEKMRCLIYPVRPLICRMMGHTNNMACPKHGQTNMSKQTLDKITRKYFELNAKYIESML